ncbi:MAG: phosphatidylglycerophosphatase A [marine bacterium B5-7]|nr:MAG: phosphatidylglycerophosphatase A [marine bacterium B5-7]
MDWSSLKRKLNAYITGAKANPIQFIATGFGSGLMPNAPGTWGTVAAIPLYLIMYHLPGWLYLLLVVAAFLVGVYLCDEAAKGLGVADDPRIVWDEFVGFWITMIGAPLDFSHLLLGFLLFRAFDILKPWPISYFDKNIPGGMGIMIDDVFAGVYALVFLQIIILFVPV